MIESRCASLSKAEARVTALSPAGWERGRKNYFLLPDSSAASRIFFFFRAASRLTRVGAVVAISAAGGRTLSPVAAVVLLASSMSGATPLEITRRIAVPMLAGLIAVAILAAMLG